MVIPTLDERDAVILHTVRAAWEREGYAPTLRDLAAKLNNRSSSIAKYRVVSRLEKRGLLNIPRKNGKIISHAMRLTQLGLIALDETERNAERVGQRKLRQASREWVNESEASDAA